MATSRLSTGHVPYILSGYVSHNVAREIFRIMFLSQLGALFAAIFHLSKQALDPCLQTTPKSCQERDWLMSSKCALPSAFVSCAFAALEICKLPTVFRLSVVSSPKKSRALCPSPLPKRVAIFVGLTPLSILPALDIRQHKALAKNQRPYYESVQ